MRAWSRQSVAAVGSLVLVWTFGCRRAAPDAESRPNILLVTIDTFRADRVGIGVSPALDGLAANGIRFTAARTAAPLTLPSHATILSGVLPPVHGVRENGSAPLGASQPSIARILQAAGYRTAAFVGAFVLDRRFGLNGGFDTYDDRIPRDLNASERLEAERPASVVIDAALKWFDKLSNEAEASSHEKRGPQKATHGGTSFFVWIHLYDPHAPYTPPAAFAARARPSSAFPLYDGEIAYADSQIARVLDWLRARGLADHTMIVVAGDHGEGLGEHGEQTHGMLVYDSTLRVPLLVASPGLVPAERRDPVSLADIAPTILRAAGVRPPAAMKGRDLFDPHPVAVDQLNTHNIQDPNDPFDAPVQFGPTVDTDARHRVTLTAVFKLPGGVQVAPFYLFRSALPVALVDGRDLNLDGDATEIPRKAYAIASFDPDKALLSQVTTKEIGDCKTVNCGRGMSQQQLNLRILKVVRLAGRANLEVLFDIFNVFNSVNPSGFRTRVTIPSGALAGQPDPTLLQPTNFSGDFRRPEQRVGQVGLRFAF